MGKTEHLIKELKLSVNAIQKINLKVDDLNNVMKTIKTLKVVLHADTPNSILLPSEVMRKRWIESLHKKVIPEIDLID